MTIPLKTRILVADDHPIVLKGLRTVLNAQADLEVVAEATDGEQAVNRSCTPAACVRSCASTSSAPAPAKP